MRTSKTSSLKGAELGSDIGIRVPHHPRPLQSFRNCRYDGASDDESKGWMRKLDADRASNKEEFKALLLDLQHRTSAYPYQRPSESPSPRGESNAATIGEQSINMNREKVHFTACSRTYLYSGG